ncbi:hypothetical protein [Puerhibacterium sp. TATVAM-FAB25]|uniref:hypothetical protein n=1 Tax=Puerhibacterium sp. TATVAM-FAB25 TaxID=3093699 RepID=UPI00397C8B90
MPNEVVVVSGVVVLACLAVAAAITLGPRRRSAPAPTTLAPVVNPKRALDDGALEPVIDDEVLILPSTVENEVFAFGDPANVREIGVPVTSSPAQLAAQATRAKAVMDGVVAYQQMVGSIVQVDAKMAAAVRAARAAKDGTGEVLAVVRGAKGHFDHIARLRSVKGLVAASSVTNAVAAMAVQAQLERVEKQLTALSEQIADVHCELLTQWDAKARAAEALLAQTYRTAGLAETLSVTNWGRVESAGLEILAHFYKDNDELAKAVSQLERLASSRSLKHREMQIEKRTAAVVAAHRALARSSKSWVQYSMLTIWRMAVLEDPSLEPHRLDLEHFIDQQAATIEQLAQRTDTAIRQLGDFRWWRSVQHPVSRTRLPAMVSSALSKAAQIKWAPLQMHAAPAQLNGTPVQPATAHDSSAPEATDLIALRTRFLEDLRALYHSRARKGQRVSRKR